MGSVTLPVYGTTTTDSKENKLFKFLRSVVIEGASCIFCIRMY